MTASTAWYRTLVSHVAHAGGRPPTLLDAAGLTEAELASPATRLTEAQELALWQAAGRELPDPLLGLRFGGSHKSAGRFGVVGYLGRAGQTWADALAAMEKYHVLLGMRCAEVVADGATVAVSFDLSPALRALRHPGEALLSGTLSAWRLATGSADRPLEVGLPRPAPAAPESYSRLLDAPVVFDSAAYVIRWSREQVARPHLARDAQAYRYFEGIAARALQSRGTCRGVLDDVRDVVAQTLERGSPSLPEVARRLALSRRTVQRRLEAADVSFSQVVDDVRRQRALALIESPTLTLSEIAYALAYKDPSALRRAFLRWSGASPHEVRQRLRSRLPVQ